MPTIVNLETVWLNDTIDPSDYQYFDCLNGLERTTKKLGRIDRGAGGRKRLILQEGTDHAWSMTLPACTREQLDWLEDHIGRIVCARDSKGHKVFVTYFETTVAEMVYDAIACNRMGIDGDTALSLEEITFLEAVR